MAISTTFTLKFVGSAVERGLARVQSAFKSLGGVAMRAGKMLLSPFAALTAMLGTGALVAGLVSFVKGSSAAAASMEDLTMQFETLTKSASITKKLLNDFREEAAKSPLSIQDYAQAGKLLLNFGTNVDDVMPRLKSLADVSMGNSDRFAGLALAFAQTTAKGRLMGQELNQMTERGFNPLQIISKKTGISIGDLMKKMEDGQIPIKAVAEAFRIATSKGGDFYQAIEKGATTTSGKIAKTKDAILGLKIAFGEGFNDGLKIALDAANTKLPQLMAKFAEFGTLIGKTISDAVNGDLTRFFMIGNMIGEAVMEGMRLVIENQWVKLGQFMQREILGGTAFLPTFESLARDKVKDEADRKQLLEGGISDFMERMKIQYAEALTLPPALPQSSGVSLNQPVPGYPRYAFSDPNKESDALIYGHAVRLIESIDRKLSPQP